MKDWQDEDQDNDTGIARFRATPKETSSPSEKKPWAFFRNFAKKILMPMAREGGVWAAAGKGLAEDYAKAKIASENNSADKVAQEAAAIAEDTDRKRQEKMAFVNTEITRIFNDCKTPSEARALQLANLIAANPKIEDYIQNVVDLIHKLQVTRGVTVEIGARMPKKRRKSALKKPLVRREPKKLPPAE